MPGALRTVFVQALLACSLLITGASAYAEPEAPSTAAAPAEYERLAQLGFSEFEAGHYAEARSRFADAYRVYPNARALRALAKCEYELQNYVAAVHAFEDALKHQVRPLTPEQRIDTETTMQEARRYLVRYDIVTQPAAAELSIDQQVATREADGTYWIPVGDHEVEVQLAGYRPARRSLHVLGGPDQKLSIMLVPVAAVETSEAHSAIKPLYKKWWVWTSVGVVVAAGVVTAAVLATRDPGTKPLHASTTHWVGNVGDKP